MNINENTKITGLPEGISIGHIQQCLSDKNLHSNIKYHYYGKRVQRGNICIYAKNNTTLIAEFRSENGWLTNLDILDKW